MSVKRSPDRRYDWGDGYVRGVDIVRVRDGQLAESLAYVKG